MCNSSFGVHTVVSPTWSPRPYSLPFHFSVFPIFLLLTSVSFFPFNLSVLIFFLRCFLASLLNLLLSSPLPLSLLTSFCLLFLSLHPYSSSAHSLSPTILLRCPCKLRWKWDSLRGELSFITHHRPDPGHINYNSPSGHLRKHTHVHAHTHMHTL